MVYDWENKEEICYRLYIEEKKSLEEIMEFMKEHHKFAPRYVIAPWALQLPYPEDTMPRPACDAYGGLTLYVATVNGHSKRNSNGGSFPRSKTLRIRTWN
jgi:hypothetical protein